MKQKQISAALKTVLILCISVAIFGFTAGDSLTANETATPDARLNGTYFHENVATIVSGEILDQESLGRMMKEAELRKAENETASEYVENYMNTHFQPSAAAMMASTNRVSIAAPGQPDQNESAACNQTALEEVISDVVGYYYAFAEKCDGTYKYDAANYTGGSTVYVRAEAGNSILEAFIIF